MAKSYKISQLPVRYVCSSLIKCDELQLVVLPGSFYNSQLRTMVSEMCPLTSRAPSANECIQTLGKMRKKLNVRPELTERSEQV